MQGCVRRSSRAPGRTRPSRPAPEAFLTLGPIRFPIWGRHPDGSCRCGQAGCRGSHPKSAGWVHWTEDQEIGPEDQTAIRTGDGLVVLDLDVKNGKNGIRALLDAGLRLPDTYTVQTRSGGLHCYFLGEARCRVGLLPGVDVRGTGGFVVVPPSLGYVVLRDTEIAEIPKWLRESSAEKESPAPEVQPLDPASPEGQRHLLYARSYLLTCPLSIEGNGGSSVAFVVAMELIRRARLPLETAAEIWQEIYNPRLVAAETTPWIGEELRHKLVQARDGGTIPVGLQDDWRNRPAERSERRRKDPKHAYHIWEFGALGVETANPVADEAVTNYLRFGEEWNGVLQWDLRAQTVKAIDPPTKLDAETDGISDSDYTRICNWFARTKGWRVKREVLRPLVEAVAKEISFDPILDYLEGLPIGAGGAIERSAAVMGLEGIEVTLLRRFLIGAVARAYEPGCKMDEMLVLVGDPAYKKSTWVEELFGIDYHAGWLPDLESKDAKELLAGNWVIEIAELTSILKSSNSACKNFISARWDKFRPAYGHNPVKRPRCCVLVGTTNDHDFLTDPTGNRRYSTVQVRREIPFGWAHAHRDEIWAEALAAYRAKERWHLDREEEADAAVEREQYGREHAWEGQIRGIIRGRREIRVHEVLEALLLPREQWPRYSQQIGDVLRKLGCSKAKRLPGEGVVWTIPEAIAALSPERVAPRALYPEARVN